MSGVYYYYLGPAVWDTSTPNFPRFRPPDGCAAMLDLRSLPDHAGGDHRPTVLCWSPSPLALEDFTLIGGGAGNCQELLPGGGDRAAWEALTGYAPSGDTLAEWLADHLQFGADPLGLDACKPLDPTAAGSVEVALDGHSIVWTRRFRGPADRFWNRLRDRLRADLAATVTAFDDEKRAIKEAAKQLRKESKGRDADKLDALAAKLENKHRQVLGGMVLKYGCDFRELTSDFAPLAPETSLTESWPSAGTITSGQDNGWERRNQGVYLGRCDVNASNRYSYVSGTSASPGFYALARCTTALSSADHLVGQTLITKGSNYATGVMTRMNTGSGTAPTAYWWILNSGSWATRFEKVVSGTVTTISTRTPTVANGSTCELSSDGSSHTYKHNSTTYGPTTDSSISSNVYPGVFMLMDTIVIPEVDNWYAQDIVSEFTASAAVSVGAATCSASGTFAAAGVSAAGAVSVGAATCSAAGTHEPPEYSAAASVTTGAASCSAAGTSGDPEYTGAAAVSVGAVTCSASGAFEKPEYSATAAVSVGAATCSATGTHEPPEYSATASVSVGAATCSAAGTHELPTFAGIAAAVIGAATASGLASSITHTAAAAVSVVAASCSAAAAFVPPPPPIDLVLAVDIWRANRHLVRAGRAAALGVGSLRSVSLLVKPSVER